jgi:hypothetical protein
MSWDSKKKKTYMKKYHMIGKTIKDEILDDKNKEKQEKEAHLKTIFGLGEHGEEGIIL